ncbi:hypothetical protein ACRAWF_10075 [Streptomyces sp. L7]
MLPVPPAPSGAARRTPRRRVTVRQPRPLPRATTARRPQPGAASAQPRHSAQRRSRHRRRLSAPHRSAPYRPPRSPSAGAHLPPRPPTRRPRPPSPARPPTSPPSCHLPLRRPHPLPASLTLDYVGSGPPTYDAEPTALPPADPDDLDDLVADTVLDGARYGSSTLRAASVRGTPRGSGVSRAGTLC